MKSCRAKCHVGNGTRKEQRGRCKETVWAEVVDPADGTKVGLCWTHYKAVEMGTRTLRSVLQGRLGFEDVVKRRGEPAS